MSGICLAMLVAVALAPALASAAPILVSAQHLDDPTARRILAECRALGLDAALQEQPDGQRTAPLEALAERWGARAVLAVCAPPESCVELWARGDARAPFRETLRPTSPTETPELLAVRAVEALRAASVQVAPQASSATAKSAPPESSRPLLRTAAASSSSSGVRAFGAAELSAVGSPAGAGVGMNLGIELGARLNRRFEVAFHASGPAARGRVAGPEGSVRIAPWLFGAGLAASLVGSEPLRLSAEVGAAALLLESTGAATAPEYEGHSAHAWALVPFLRPKLRCAIAARWALSAAALVGLATPRFEVELAHRTVATWGRPVLAAEFGAEYTWGD